jgi:hypothetical protein
VRASGWAAGGGTVRREPSLEPGRARRRTRRRAACRALAWLGLVASFVASAAIESASIRVRGRAPAQVRGSQVPYGLRFGGAGAEPPQKKNEFLIVGNLVL